MDLNMALWAGGTLFTLTGFAVKVGFGLGYGQVGGKGIGVTLTVYALLFAGMAVLSEKLMGWLAPILGGGSYLHWFMAAGLLAWGVYAIASAGRSKHDCATQSGVKWGASLLLIIPCPVCLTAMVFSTWAALNAIHCPALLVGLGLGAVFAALSLLFLFFARARKTESPETSLGLVMIAVGLYFALSLLLPAKIEAARAMYSSFAEKSNFPVHTDATFVLLSLVAALVAGYFLMERKNIK
ncbi:MAG TPA: transporter [Syntrophaceae bacterium]|nr:transporter [Syntrophaceae bacterium]HCX01459.1 transporter [Syntrophaceae bacterium]